MQKFTFSPITPDNFEAALQDLNAYKQSPSRIRKAFKHYQLGQIKLLAYYDPNWTTITFYTKLYRMMKRYSFLGYILAKPSTFDLYLPGRLFLLRKWLLRDGFTYDPTLKCWHYYAN
jgi:hypothetical protein